MAESDMKTRKMRPVAEAAGELMVTVSSTGALSTAGSSRHCPACGGLKRPVRAA